jgi:hypothetical protein
MGAILAQGTRARKQNDIVSRQLAWRFQAKRAPVRVKKTRQNKKLIRRQSRTRVRTSRSRRA